MVHGIYGGPPGYYFPKVIFSVLGVFFFVPANSVNLDEMPVYAKEPVLGFQSTIGLRG